MYVSLLGIFRISECSGLKWKSEVGKKCKSWLQKIASGKYFRKNLYLHKILDRWLTFLTFPASGAHGQGRPSDLSDSSDGLVLHPVRLGTDFMSGFASKFIAWDVLLVPSLGDVIIVQWVTRCEWQGYYSLVNPSYSWRWVKRLKCFRLKQFLDIYKAWLSPAAISGKLETSAELRK